MAGPGDEGQQEDLERLVGEGGPAAGVPAPRPNRPPKRRSLFIQVCAGLRSPLETYLLWNIFVGGLVVCVGLGRGVLPLFMEEDPTVSTDPVAFWLPIAVYLTVVFLYGVWSLLGLWRSGSLHTGPMAEAAKMLTVINVILLFWALNRIVMQTYILPKLCGGNEVPAFLCKAAGL